MFGFTARSTRRIVIATAALLLVGLTLATGSAVAHNPACQLVAGDDGPHYDDDPQTGSETAYEKNKNLGGDEHPDQSNARGGCTVGNATVGDGGH